MQRARIRRCGYGPRAPSHSDSVGTAGSVAAPLAVAMAPTSWTLCARSTLTPAGSHPRRLSWCRPPTRRRGRSGRPGHRGIPSAPADLVAIADSAPRVPADLAPCAIAICIDRRSCLQPFELDAAGTGPPDCGDRAGRPRPPRPRPAVSHTASGGDALGRRDLAQVELDVTGVATRRGRPEPGIEATYGSLPPFVRPLRARV
jgi:hypothetical protein